MDNFRLEHWEGCRAHARECRLQLLKSYDELIGSSLLATALWILVYLWLTTTVPGWVLGLTMLVEAALMLNIPSVLSNIAEDKRALIAADLNAQRALELCNPWEEIWQREMPQVAAKSKRR